MATQIEIAETLERQKKTIVGLEDKLRVAREENGNLRGQLGRLPDVESELAEAVRERNDAVTAHRSADASARQARAAQAELEAEAGGLREQLDAFQAERRAQERIAALVT